ncbi:MAG: hypothetical protein EOP84_29115 [Verrucomicrobiaceae bacterium]|nr:MAG: hypothetical protein EOP84_29115 [Verrucomicrobiaceae bacterium]
MRSRARVPAAELLRQERERVNAMRVEFMRLVDWLVIIETRAEQLHENVMGVAVNDHDDVNIEVAQSAALADIAEQVLSDARAALARSLPPVDDEPSALPESVEIPQGQGTAASEKRGALQAALL